MPEDFYEIPNDVNEILNKCGSQYIAKDYSDVCLNANSSYRNAINDLKKCEKNGIITNEEFKRAREILRGQLPVAGMTERTTIINLRSFANYQKQRNSSYAQPEIKMVAQLMLEEVEKSNVCPVAIKTLKEINWVI
jgi:thymidylate synthase ThyX